MKTHSYIEEIKKICNNNHFTVDEIFEKIKARYPKAWKSTIYRNVEELSNKWLLKKLIGAHNKSIYELNIGNHLHLINEKSGEIIDLDLENLKIPWIPANFKVNSIDIKIFWKFI